MHRDGCGSSNFWQQPAVMRSDSPHAFAASGPQASHITAPHPVDLPHGLNSPVGRVLSWMVRFFLLGVGHDSNTTIHLAEHLAGVRYRRKKHVTLLKEEDSTVSNMLRLTTAARILTGLTNGSMLRSYSITGQ